MRARIAVGFHQSQVSQDFQMLRHGWLRHPKSSGNRPHAQLMPVTNANNCSTFSRVGSLSPLNNSVSPLSNASVVRLLMRIRISHNLYQQHASPFSVKQFFQQRDTCCNRRTAWHIRLSLYQFRSTGTGRSLRLLPVFILRSLLLAQFVK